MGRAAVIFAGVLGLFERFRGRRRSEGVGMQA
ncbi:hypothetical protein LINPERHAP1_LOCUS26868 [Linum perenne]